MHKFKKIIPILVIGLFVSFSLSGCFGNDELVSNSQSLKDGLSEIDIDVDSANVIIEQGEEALITYSFPKNVKVDYSYDNGKVTLKGKNGISLFSSGSNSEVKITIPKDKELSITTAKSDSGNISINNIKCEQINCELDSGNLTMNNNNAKKLVAKVDSGNITEDGDIESIEANADSGNINLSGNVYIVKAETDSGDITIDSKKSQSEMRLNLDTDFGKITINGKSIN